MSTYWIKRAESILLAREKVTELYLDKIARIYKSTENQINLEIQKIFNKYSKSGDLLEEEARVLLSNKETKEYYNNLLKQINNIKDKDIKKQLLSKYNAPAYNYRISRLEALKNDIYIKCKTLADKELEYTTKHYTDTIKNTYSDYTQAISQYKTSQAISFATIDNNVLNRILTTKWLDSNFSQRIWGNTELLANNVNNILQKGLLVGLSNQKMSKELKDIMKTSTFNAERLIRTETNHFHNQAELQSYKDNGIIYYKYLAILDNKTSLVCTKLNGKIFRLEDAKTGINYPPMHPFCRSTTIPVFEEELDDEGIISDIFGNNKLEDITNQKQQIINNAFTNKNIELIALNTEIKSIKLGGNKAYHRCGNIVLRENYDNRTLIHEIGHTVDYNNNWMSSTDSFAKAIQLDKQYVLNNQILFKELIKDNSNYRELSDIIGGMTNNKVVGKYKHKDDYWSKSNKIERETFAQMFTMAGTDDLKQLKLFQKYLPNIFKEFDNLIRRLL